MLAIDEHMKCDGCGQRSDWIGERSRWSPVHRDEVVTLQLYECDDCGHRQTIR